jgi:tRNA (guanine10-N2)-dimethyltransferase
MELVFYLSGEHGTLPKSEVLSLISHRFVDCRIIEDLDQILVCKVEDIDTTSFGLLGMTHEVLHCIGSCEATLDEILTLAIKAGKIQDNFSVRVTRIKHYTKGLRLTDLERLIGGVIDGESVNLSNPKVSFRGFLTSDSFVFGKTLQEIKRSAFKKRDPQLRPFFHPSSLTPMLARTLCNISGVMEGKKVLDPFCGPGGFLIEAGTLGADVSGIDIEAKMVRGARNNLAYYGVKGRVDLGDATELKIKHKFDIVLTDPPYGRGSTTKGREVENLYDEGTASIFRALKKGGTACIISPDSIDLEEIAIKNKFKICETHLMRVHRSLTRKIVIMKK